MTIFTAISDWPPVHDEVLHEVMRLSREGTRVIYIPGNHDAELRRFDGTDHHLIEIGRRHIHETRCGRRLLVTHGDELDRDLRVGSLKERLGSAAYPVTGPLDVIEQGRTGVLHEDLGVAVRRALALDRGACRQAALEKSWARATVEFPGHLARKDAMTRRDIARASPGAVDP